MSVWENSAKTVGHCVSGGVLRKVEPSCRVFWRPVTQELKKVAQDGRFSYRNGKKSYRTGDFVTGSRQNEAGPATARQRGENRMLMNEFRCKNSDEKQNKPTAQSSWLKAKNSIKPKIKTDTLLSTKPEFSPLSANRRGNKRNVRKTEGAVVANISKAIAYET